MVRAASLALTMVALLTTQVGCKRSKHPRVSSYAPPPVPAGFVERSGTGWRIATPAAWKENMQRGPAAWAAADPQAVDDFRAQASVFTEPFAGESYDYAQANEVALRGEPRATIEATREEVIDGDPTLLIESRWAPTHPASVQYRTMQSALASRGAGYVVTCSVAGVAFERYRSTCESIVRSFAVER
jgi:hypothetical protein